MKTAHYVGTLKITLWDLFCLIWAAGAIILFFRYMLQYRRTGKMIQTRGEDITSEEPYRDILQSVCDRKKQKNRFRVMRMSGFSMPVLFGIFRPVILLPESMELSEEELGIVLGHEAFHHFHHDLLLKAIVRIITIIYWWNPFCRILNRQADVILDMRVDDRLTENQSEFRYRYLSCLLHLLKMAEAEPPFDRGITVSICREEALLTKRFELLKDGGKRKGGRLTLATSFLAIVLFFGSYLYIFEAMYFSPEVTETTFGLDRENAYLVRKKDGTYDIYLWGKFLHSTDDLEGYLYYDLLIYDEEGNLIED
ncbi:MAG: M56 family metallopeptidase [bacterium]|nr:M56 family metallopeptidase [bacterium]